MKTVTDQKSVFFSTEFNDTFNDEQLRDLHEKKVGNWLYVIGLQLELVKLSNGVLSKLVELETYLSKLDQSVGSFWIELCSPQWLLWYNTGYWNILLKRWDLQLLSVIVRS